MRSGDKSGIQKTFAELSVLTDLPTIRILQKGEEMRRYPYTGKVEEITVASIKNFIDDFKAGKVKRHMKSEVPPDPQFDVFTIVADTWTEITQQPKDVLVFYYAPYCKACFRMSEQYEKLAALCKPAEDIVIARYNTPDNEHEQVKFSRFPMIRLYTKDNQEIDFWEYGDDPDNMFNEWKAFMNEHSAAFRNVLNQKEFKVNTEL